MRQRGFCPWTRGNLRRLLQPCWRHAARPACPARRQPLNCTCWMTPPSARQTGVAWAAPALPMCFLFLGAATPPVLFCFNWTRCAGNACCTDRNPQSMPCGCWRTAWPICAGLITASRWMRQAPYLCRLRQPRWLDTARDAAIAAGSGVRRSVFCVAPPEPRTAAHAACGRNLRPGCAILPAGVWR